MGDTFHMNIEEASIPDALRSARGLLNHVHLADSNRAVAGRGHTDFRPILQALLDINYDGYLSFEVMAPSGDPMEIPEGAGTASFDADTKQAIEHLKGGGGSKVYSLRLSQRIRAIAVRDGALLRLISLHPEHDSTYQRR